MMAKVQPNSIIIFACLAKWWSINHTDENMLLENCTMCKHLFQRCSPIPWKLFEQPSTVGYLSISICKYCTSLFSKMCYFFFMACFTGWMLRALLKYLLKVKSFILPNICILSVIMYICILSCCIGSLQLTRKAFASNCFAAQMKSRLFSGGKKGFEL